MSSTTSRGTTSARSRSRCTRRISQDDRAPIVDARFEDLPWERQAAWLREAAADAWYASSFSLDAVGLGLPAAVREAGVEEAKNWPAYTDRRKVFRVSSATFSPGWLTLAFQARASATGESGEHAHVAVHICPKCAPAIFDAANVNPIDPFGDGVRY